jgi:hypothetical protein
LKELINWIDNQIRVAEDCWVNILLKAFTVCIPTLKMSGTMLRRLQQAKEQQEEHMFQIGKWQASYY